MKKLLIFILACMSIKTGKAQLNQNATQKKYLLEQIAALQAYLGYLQKGYSIATKGLNTIRDIKRGDLNLHSEYFNSLKAVSPTVRNYIKVAAIIALQLKIIKVYKDAMAQVRKGGAFNKEEIAYLDSVFDRLLEDCSKTIEELTAVTTDNQLQMKDDERIKRIDLLYADMQDKYTFVQAYSAEAKTLAGARHREQNNVQTSRAIYGIKK